MGKQISFDKYQGAGNDFIIVDARPAGDQLFSKEIIKKLCDRHFGIGADGFILLLASDDRDFYMKYFNSDGFESSMCGNGGRCIVSFAKDIGITDKKAFFSGIDGDHLAFITGNGDVSLKMKDVSDIIYFEDGLFLDTGSPHFVIFSTKIETMDVPVLGKEIRYQSRFSPGGTNVNFVEFLGTNDFAIRTYERGVENETLACGTGSVASAIASFSINKPETAEYTVHATGGNLRVKFTPLSERSYTDIWLTGPTEFVFRGEIEI